MEISGKNIIANTWSGEGQQTFYGFNPSNNSTLEPAFIEATFSEIDLAIKKADQAFQIYRNVPGRTRAIFLETIASEIVALGDDLIKRCMEETGLPEARLVGERGRTVNQLKLFAELLKEGSWVDARLDLADPERKPLPKPDIRSMMKALGPVGVFGASNFPLAFSVAGGDTASALAAGCTVVVKAHQAHPGTSEMVGRAIQSAVQKSGMPEGTFSLVQGRSVDVGLAIVRHPLIKAIGFTGSFRGGKALFDEANRRPVPIPVYAEMGSSNPVFILPQVMAERGENIAKDLSASVTLGVGQFCTNPGLVFFSESNEANRFKLSLAASIKDAASGVMLSQGICENYNSGLKRLTAKKEIKELARGLDSGQNNHGIAHLFETSSDSFLRDPSIEEEVFGPSSLIVSMNKLEEYMDVVDKLSGHLTATIHGTEEDLIQFEPFVKKLEQKVGRIIFNGYPTGVEVCHAMVHGGPFPATSDGRSTSVGTAAIFRFVRPVSYQNFPSQVLPDELKDANPLNIWRMVNGERVKK